MREEGFPKLNEGIDSVNGEPETTLRKRVKGELVELAKLSPEERVATIQARIEELKIGKTTLTSEEKRAHEEREKRARVLREEGR